MTQQFLCFDPVSRQLSAATGAVEHYPGGDVAVRHLYPAKSGSTAVYWNCGGTLNYEAAGQWAAFHAAENTRAILVMPYLPSARGDHDVTSDAQVSARLTAAAGITDVIAVDPHSAAWGDSAAACGTTVHVISAADLIADSTLAADHWEWRAVIAPDKGAVDRASMVAQVLGVPLLTARKVRDSATGRLSGFTAPEGVERGRYLVVDDICDGGGTFAGLAQVVRETEPAVQLHLWVTHGLFTGRWRENLLPNFASTTAANTTWNGHRDALPREIRQLSVQQHVIDVLVRLHLVAMGAR